MRIVWIGLGLIGALVLYLVISGENAQTFGLGNSQFAQIALYSMWGALIGAAIIPRQGGLKTAARNATIWIFIILLLVAGYTLRHDLQQIGARVTGGLIPGRPVSTQTADGSLQVELGKSLNGHFVAQTMINGSTIRMLVDTGASAIVLSEADAQKAGIDLATLSYVVPVRTANGNTVAAPIRLDRVSVGDIERRNVSALVAREGALDQSLLGMSFLNMLQRFEFSGDRLVLVD